MRGAASREKRYLTRLECSKDILILFSLEIFFDLCYCVEMICNFQINFVSWKGDVLLPFDAANYLYLFEIWMLSSTYCKERESNQLALFSEVAKSLLLSIEWLAK